MDFLAKMLIPNTKLGQCWVFNVWCPAGGTPEAQRDHETHCMFFRLALPLSNHQDAPEQDLHVVPGQVASPPRADQCRGHPVLLLHASAKALGQQGSKALEFGWQPGLNKPVRKGWFSGSHAMGDGDDRDFLSFTWQCL